MMLKKLFAGSDGAVKQLSEEPFTPILGLPILWRLSPRRETILVPQTVEEATLLQVLINVHKGIGEQKDKKGKRKTWIQRKKFIEIRIHSTIGCSRCPQVQI
jgi:hypothetical protein